MSNQTMTPFGAALAFQRSATRMGQRTFERGMEAQRAMTEAVVRNSLGMGRTVNRTATQATRQNATAVADVMDLWFPGTDTRRSVEQGFDSVLDAQDTAWRVVEESAEGALASYADATESQQELVGESVSSTLDAHERVASGAGDAAVEYERQSPEGVGTGRQRGAGSESTGRRPGADGEGAVHPDESVTTGPEAETATEPEVETAEREEPTEAGTAGTGATESGTTGVGLDDISGVGAAYARRLESAGIESVEALRDADVAELSEETEISDERIANWQRQARHLLESEGE